MVCERGQATVEWTGLVLLVALVLATLAAVAPVVDGRSLGSAVAHSIVCATRGDCDRGNDTLVDAYGREDAELVRRYAPNIVYEPGTYTLPIDYRECRSHSCSDAPDDRSLDGDGPGEEDVSRGRDPGQRGLLILWREEHRHDAPRRDQRGA